MAPLFDTEQIMRGHGGFHLPARQKARSILFRALRPNTTGFTIVGNADQAVLPRQNSIATLVSGLLRSDRQATEWTRWSRVHSLKKIRHWSLSS